MIIKTRKIPAISRWPVAAALLMLLGCAEPDTSTFSMPRGSTISIRTLDEISTKVYRAGDPFEAQLSSPIRRGSVIIVPLGARVTGLVKEIRPRQADIRQAQADLRLTRLYLSNESYVELRTAALLREAAPGANEVVVVAKNSPLIFTLEEAVPIPQNP